MEGREDFGLFGMRCASGRQCQQKFDSERTCTHFAFRTTPQPWPDIASVVLCAVGSVVLLSKAREDVTGAGALVFGAVSSVGGAGALLFGAVSSMGGAGALLFGAVSSMGGAGALVFGAVSSVVLFPAIGGAGALLLGAARFVGAVLEAIFLLGRK